MLKFKSPKRHWLQILEQGKSLQSRVCNMLFDKQTRLGMELLDRYLTWLDFLLPIFYCQSRVEDLVPQESEWASDHTLASLQLVLVST